jgi:osmotically inducible protein OsmC
MLERKGRAVWEGTLKDGNGTVALGSGLWEGPYSFRSRFVDEKPNATNPEELVGAALAACFSQAFSLDLEEAGYPPERVRTEALVRLEKKGEGFSITSIHLSAEAVVPGISEEKFRSLAEASKNGCPVSRALAGPQKTISAKLLRQD